MKKKNIIKKESEFTEIIHNCQYKKNNLKANKIFVAIRQTKREYFSNFNG